MAEPTRWHQNLARPHPERRHRQEATSPTASASGATSFGTAAIGSATAASSTESDFVPSSVSVPRGASFGCRVLRHIPVDGMRLADARPSQASHPWCPCRQARSRLFAAVECCWPEASVRHRRSQRNRWTRDRQRRPRPGTDRRPREQENARAKRDRDDPPSRPTAWARRGILGGPSSGPAESRMRRAHHPYPRTAGASRATSHRRDCLSICCQRGGPSAHQPAHRVTLRQARCRPLRNSIGDADPGSGMQRS